MRNILIWTGLLVANALFAMFVSWWVEVGLSWARGSVGLQPVPIDSAVGVFAFFAAFVFLTCAELASTIQSELRADHRQIVKDMKAVFQEAGQGMLDTHIIRALASSAVGAGGVAPALTVLLSSHIASWKDEITEMMGQGIPLESSRSVTLARALASGANSFRWVETRILNIKTDWTPPFKGFLRELAARSDVTRECILLVKKQDLLDRWDDVTRMREFLKQVRVKLFWADWGEVTASFSGDYPRFYCIEQFGSSTYLVIHDVPGDKYSSSQPFMVQVVEVAQDHQYSQLMQHIATVRQRVSLRQPK